MKRNIQFYSFWIVWICSCLSLVLAVSSVSEWTFCAIGFGMWVCLAPTLLQGEVLEPVIPMLWRPTYVMAIVAVLMRVLALTRPYTLLAHVIVIMIMIRAEGGVACGTEES